MTPIHNKAIAYRPEIDGLRTIAVLPVILFHAGIEIFSGGFVGVDIFFVISGYLITSIILREMETGNFSVIRFYERRARRILPALFFVIFLCFPFAYFLMLPDELKRFGLSVLSVAVFSSNIYFWQKTNYFSSNAEEQPLLHTWSLAVEEQYYFLFPLFLMVLWRHGKNKLFLSTVFIAVLSICLTEWAWRSAPSANFYLLPTRAWELLAGSLLAFINYKEIQKFKSGQLAQFSSLFGLFLIGYSIIFFNGKTPFPSLYSLIPVLGTVLVIACSSTENIAGRILSQKLIVGIGLISYSAYLWHQPIFAFFRLYYVTDPGKSVFLFGAFLSLVMAWFSWKFVEAPFREKFILDQKLVFVFSGTGLAFLISVGMLVNFDVFKGKYSQTLVDFKLQKKWTEECMLFGKETRDLSKACTYRNEWGENKPRKILLWGDSHADAYQLAIEEYFKDSNYRIVSMTAASCPPLLGLNIHDVNNGVNCDQRNRNIL